MESSFNMTPELREALSRAEQRLAKTRPAPWIVENAKDGTSLIRTGGVSGEPMRITEDQQPSGAANLAFIAKSRNVMPALIRALQTGDREALEAGEIEEIYRLLASASLGPWEAFLEHSQPIGGSSFIRIGDSDNPPDMYVWNGEQIASDSDIDFIAHARQDIPVFIDALRRFRAESI